MTRETASRQPWSSLRTWLRKPQMVVAGPNTRSRYSTPCSVRTSMMLASVKTSANGSPSLRAKRARTASRLGIESPSAFRGGVLGTELVALLSAAVRRHSLFFAGAAAAETLKLVPFGRHPAGDVAAARHASGTGTGCAGEVHRLPQGSPPRRRRCFFLFHPDDH